MPDLQGRKHSSAPTLYARFRELPGKPSQGDVFILAHRSLPEVPASATGRTTAPPTVGQRTHGCHNRPPLATSIDVQDGWHGGKRVMDTLPTNWAAGCRYTEFGNNRNDPACNGCKWKAHA